MLTYRESYRLHLMKQKSGKALCSLGERVIGQDFGWNSFLLEFRNSSSSSYGQSAQVRIAKEI
jgi:hypothetical protein